MTVLRLFPSEQDAGEDRRWALARRAHLQPRCTSCGRFANEFWFETICLSCMTDTRPTIAHKVDQARRWWVNVRTGHL